MSFIKVTPDSNEDTIQAAFVEQCRMNQKFIPELEMLYSVPNGGKRSITGAMIMRATGLSPGVPDMVLAVMRSGYGALYIEFKTPTGRLSPEQVKWHARLTKQGYKVVVARSVEDAVEAVRGYLFPTV